MAEYFEYAYLDRFSAHSETSENVSGRIDFDRLITEREDKLFPRPGGTLKSLNHWGGQGWQVLTVDEHPSDSPPDTAALQTIVRKLHPNSTGVLPGYTRYLLTRRGRK